MSYGTIMRLPYQRDLGYSHSIQIESSLGESRRAPKRVFGHPVLLLSVSTSKFPLIVRCINVSSTFSQPTKTTTEKNKLTSFGCRTLDERYPQAASEWGNYVPMHPSPAHPRQETDSLYQTLHLRDSGRLPKASYVNIKNIYSVDYCALRPFDRGAHRLSGLSMLGLIRLIKRLHGTTIILDRLPIAIPVTPPPIRSILKISPPDSLFSELSLVTPPSAIRSPSSFYADGTAQHTPLIAAAKEPLPPAPLTDLSTPGEQSESCASFTDTENLLPGEVVSHDEAVETGIDRNAKSAVYIILLAFWKLYSMLKGASRASRRNIRDGVAASLVLAGFRRLTERDATCISENV